MSHPWATYQSTSTLSASTLPWREEGERAEDGGIVGVLHTGGKHTAIQVRSPLLLHFLVGTDLAFFLKSQFSSTRNPLNSSMFSFCAGKKAFLLAQI